MSIQNSKPVIFYPLVLAFVLIAGIFIGVKLSHTAITQRLLIYPRVEKVNNVLNLIEDSYVDSVSRDKLEEVAIESILDHLDPHSVYIPANKVQALNESLEGNFDGIGVQFNVFDDTLVVITLVPKGPSEKSGIKPGDRIVMVNDSVVAGVHKNSDDIVNMLRGKKGTSVKVTVKRNGNPEPLSFSIVRDIIPLNSIDAEYMVEPGVGYIRLNKFAKSSADEFIAAARQLHAQGAKKMIVDLRGNGGGLLDVAIKIADQFLNANHLIVYTEGRARPRINSYSTKGGECLNDSVIVLMDEYSASASEILAGAIQDNDRGLVVGRRSFGKGLVQEQSSLPGGSAIRLTIARYYTPTGRCIQKSYTHGVESYYEELRDRYKNGELEQKDSIKFNDSLKFVTPGGHVVYGGGGIMPDVFVPLDTTDNSAYYNKVRQKGLLYRFAFSYSDHNRKDLSLAPSYTELFKYLEKQDLLKKFVAYTTKQSIKPTPDELKKSGKSITNLLDAYIVRNFYDEGFYPVLNMNDNTISAALDVFNGKK